MCIKFDEISRPQAAASLAGANGLKTRDKVHSLTTLTWAIVSSEWSTAHPSLNTHSLGHWLHYYT